MKKNPKPAPLDPLDYYAKNPSFRVGEFAHAQAQVADLNAKTSTETQRTGDGAPAR